MARRYFSSTAIATTLAASISNSATSITVSSLTGFPNSTPWTAIIDEGTASEEVVEVTNVAGLTLTVTRGADGTSAVSHGNAASFRHGVSGRDFDEANSHVNASSGVHGLSGSVVGTSDAQTLTNKTISGASNTLSSIAQSSVTNLTTDLAAKAPVANPTITGVLSVPDGTVSAPAITNTGDTDTGTYFPDANTVGITAGGVEAARFTSTGIASPSMVELQQYSADLSVLRNIPARVHPAESLLKQAVWWIDSAHSSASGQTVSNLGWGGSALDATVGSSGSADSNDAKYLDWTGENYVYLPGVNGNCMSVPDADSLDIVGDIDIRLRVSLDDWTPAGNAYFGGKGQGAWFWSYQNNKTMRFYWTEAGGTSRNADSTSAISQTSGALWVRVVLDVDNGSSQYEVKYYTAADSASEPTSWTQLGNTVTGSTGVTDIKATTDAVYVNGYGAASGQANAAGSYYRFIVRSGIAGTPVLDVDTSLISSGSATSFTARTGQTVTINRSTSGRKAVAVTHPVWLLGTDDYMEVADSSLLDMSATDSFTAVAIVRMWSTPTSSGHILSKRKDSSPYDGWSIQSSGTNIAPLVDLNDSTDEVFPSGTTVSAGTLMMAGALVDRSANTLKVITNLALSSGTSLSAIDSLANSYPLRVGAAGSGATYQNFEFVAAAVWRRALTADEIRILNDYFKGRAA